MSYKIQGFFLIILILAIVIFYFFKFDVKKNLSRTIVFIVVFYMLYDKLYIEGYMNEKQSEFLSRMVKNPNIKNVMQIGFNAGHSAESLLKANTDINLISFDIGEHHYVKNSADTIDKKFPGRHKLIIGNSTNTVVDFINKNQNMKFDLIFIDGGHSYQVAKADLINCAKLAHKDTIVIMDDTFQYFYMPGPRNAWDELIKDGIILELGYNKYGGSSGDSWGKYVF